MELNIKPKSSVAVVGLNYGDEGKGVITDALCSLNGVDYVVRHNGGHQVGHTVKIDDKIHVFQHFGAGTFRGKPTFWLKNCTVFPISFVREFLQLEGNFGITPSFYCDNACPITTHYDVVFNRVMNRVNNHGSVGVGFAATLKRNEYIKLLVEDLLFKEIFIQKVEMVKKYYFNLIHDLSEKNSNIENLWEEEYEAFCFYDKDFHEHCDFFVKKIKRDELEDNFLNSYSWNGCIYEGNQGIMLDRDFGFFPNVTYAQTSSPKDFLLDEIFYTSRVYTTRHGNGPLPYAHNKDLLKLVNTEYEQNVLNPYQGEFRIAPLNIDNLKYSILKDETRIRKKDQNFLSLPKRSIVFSCIDQIEGDIPVIIDGEIEFVDFRNPKIFYEKIGSSLVNSGISNFYGNISPESKTIFKIER